MRYYYKIKRIIKSILYALPKSFLIFIILTLLFIIKNGTFVEASSIPLPPVEDLTFYEYIDITNVQVDTGYFPTTDTDFDLTVKIDRQKPDGSYTGWNDVFSANGTFLLVQSGNSSSTAFTYYVGGQSVGGTSFPNNEKSVFSFIAQAKNILTVNDIFAGSREGLELVNTSATLKLNSNIKPTSYLFYELLVYYNINGAVLNHFVPASYNNNFFIYDLINHNAIHYFDSSVVVGPVIPNPTGSGGSGDSGDSGDSDSNYTDVIEGVKDSVDNLNNTQQETNDFLKDTTVSDDNFVLPSVDIDDPTADFFDTIFLGLYDSFTNTEPVDITFSAMGISFTFSSSDFSFLSDEKFALLRFILQSGWVVSIGLLIIKDLRSMLEDIKEGDIDKLAKNGDIKANMV